MSPILAKVVVIFLGILGFLLALWIRHKKTKQEPMVCPFTGECGEVVNSRYSKFLGMDLTIIGVGYYAAITLIYWMLLMFHSLVVPEVVFLLLTMTTFAFLFSLYLTGVQAFILKKWCTWCLFSVSLCMLIFITTIAGLELDVKALLLNYKGIITLLHTIAAAIGVGAVTITEIFFFRFLEDYRISNDEAEIMHTLSNVVWFALGFFVLTGLGLFIPMTESVLLQSQIVMKIFLALVLIVTGIILTLVAYPRLVDISFGEADVKDEGELSHLRRLVYAFGGISIVTWYSVFILEYIQDTGLTFGQLFSIYAILATVAVALSQYMDYLMSNRKI